MQPTPSTSGLILTALIACAGAGLILPGQAAFSADRVIATSDPAADKPADPGKVDEITWGDEVYGLQAGIALTSAPKDAHHVGDTVLFTIKVRGVGKQPVTISYSASFFANNPPIVRDAKGEQVRVDMPPSARSYVYRPLIERTLRPGEIIELGKEELALLPDGKLAPIHIPSLTFGPADAKPDNVSGATIDAQPGKYSVIYAGFIQSAPKLATPMLRIDVQK